jgi:hypothetical protein
MKTFAIWHLRPDLQRHSVPFAKLAHHIANRAPHLTATRWLQPYEKERKHGDLLFSSDSRDRTKSPLCKAVAFAAGLGLSMLSYPVHVAPASGGDTVQGLYDALLSTMKNGRTLGQSGRFALPEPVIRCSSLQPVRARPVSKS